ncbi:MAG TPA: alpha/beta fold hydrolase [Gemmatimonadaceae bacterium]|nr:alpha/beta fold hydrolase [Gemmatimonadaceae bacterium]
MRLRSCHPATMLPLALAAAAHLLPAQQPGPERASFYLLLRGDTIFEERDSRTPTELSGEFRDRLRNVRVSYDATLNSSALVTHLDLRTFRSSQGTGDPATFTIDGDSVVAKIGNAAPAKIPSISGALAIVNPAVGFIEQIVMRARAIGGDPASVMIFVIGAPQPLAGTVTRVGADSVRVAYAGVTMDLAVSPTGRVLGGVIPAQGIRIARGAALGAISAAPATNYSAPPNAPYVAEDVVVTTSTELHLAGTLTIPKVRPSGKVPAVITITGSGPEDRDEQSGAIPGYRPFRELADTLGRRGIAVLRLDDRGVGASDAGPASVTSADFANDIRTGIAYLRSRPEIDGSRIGIVGHSEGGIIAPMIAVGDPKLRGLVLMAGSASKGREIVMDQNRYVIDSVAHLRGPTRDSALAKAGRSVDSLGAQGGWLGFFLAYDPTTAARQVKTPVLILQGETDRQVPPAQARLLADAFRAGGNRDVTVRMFPATNHLFLADSSGAFADASGALRYTKLPSLHVRPEVLGAIADWLNDRLK